MRTWFRRVPAVAVALVVLLGSAIATPILAANPEPSGYRVQRGAQLDGFRVPVDVRLVSSRTDRSSGLTFERYQQFAAPLDVQVDGAQLSVVRRGDKVVLVIGKHYPDLRAIVRPSVATLRAAAAAAVNAPRVARVNIRPAELTTRRSEMRINPETARIFYLVESVAPGVRVFTEVDAQSGNVIEAWSALHGLEPGQGNGLKGDTKSLAGLTKKNSNGLWIMHSPDGRFVTEDEDKGYLPLRDRHYGGDNDNIWNAAAERSGVDAQFYAKQTYDFLLDRYGFDLLDTDLRKPGSEWCQFDTITSVVHVGDDYDNAYWDGISLNYGDGDGTFYRAFSAAQDVVAHEFGHAVTECRVPLAYHNAPGALNESFSDIVATAMEWLHEEPNSTNCRRAVGQATCADWWLGEDLVIGGASYAIRSLGNPAAEGQPSHLANARYLNSTPTYWNDYGGVHLNSGISNHAFFLMVEGGRNARCSGPTDSLADCDVMVTPTTMDHAAEIAFVAWGDLMSTEAKFCEARDAMVEAAQLLYAPADVAATDLGWRAVGVGPCSSKSTFSVKPAQRSISVAPGSGPVSVTLTLTRGVNHTAPVTFTVADAAPVAASITGPSTLSGSASTVQLEIDSSGVANGSYPVTVFASDGSPVAVPVAVTLIVDGDAPSTTIDDVRLLLSSTVTAGGQVPMLVSWSSTDALSGVASGGAGPSLGSTPNGFRTSNYAPNSYTFTSNATDAVGNSATSAPRRVVLSTAQESAATFAGGWTTATGSAPWGTTRFSSRRGASATYSFTGTDVAWVAPRGPKRGRARVFIDGALKATVDLYSASFAERRVVFVADDLAPGPHTIKIVVRATSGRPRVDIDGFVTIRPGL